MENTVLNEELQSEYGQATEVESDYLVDNKECSEKVLVLKYHSGSNTHYSPFRCHSSD